MTVDKIDIREGRESSYRRLVRPRMMDELKKGILRQIAVKRKYRNPNYNARKLAEDLQTNVRYISAVVRVQFHMNYSSFVNKYRVEEAKSILADQRYFDLKLEDVGDMVGFAHRQSFYAAFQKYTGMTPKAYRNHYLDNENQI